MIDQTNRRQVLVLRELGTRPIHAGRRSIGPRLLAREAGWPGKPDAIQRRLAGRHFPGASELTLAGDRRRRS
jgi:hypothetical protein